MKKTIKEELETKYLKQELVNDNTLLLYEQLTDDLIEVKMRYIDFNRLKELSVAHLSLEEYVEGNSLRVNDNNTALAIFKKIDKEERLSDMYDLETHCKACSDLLDWSYNIKFNKDNKQYTK